MHMRIVLLPLLLLLAGPRQPIKPVPLLVDAEWLGRNINSPHVVLLHVGERAGYDAEHLPGARYVSLNDIALPHDHESDELALELPDAAALRRTFEALGVSDDSHIIVYYGNDWVTPATRLVFTLDHLGLGDRTSLLNGGMRAWKNAGRVVTAEIPGHRAGRITPRPTRAIVVDAAQAAAAAKRPGTKLVDARAPVFYAGVEPTNGKAGHIPGAVNIPFNSLMNDALVMERGEVEKLFRNAGIREGDVVVGYCHIGQQATLVLFAARLLGHDVRLYDGSFQDWATRNRGEVER